MTGAVFLEGDRITLRTIEEEDLEFIRDNFNDPEVRQGLSYHQPNNLEQERDWFENVVCDDGNINMAIYHDSRIMGAIGLKEKENGETGEIGIWIASEFHGQGFGTEAAGVITDYAFKQLRYHKVFARAFESNKSSQRVWEKLDFEKEGELREHVYKNNEYQDVYVYSVLEQDW